jgi:hypothetical protein
MPGRVNGALAFAALALAATPALAGEATYGVVCFDPSNGELRGTRVVLSQESGKPIVLFQHCAPGCTRHKTMSASLIGQTLQFEIASLAKETERARFSGRIRGAALSLEGHTPTYNFKRAILRKNQRCPKDTVLADP